MNRMKKTAFWAGLFSLIVWTTAYAQNLVTDRTEASAVAETDYFYTINSAGTADYKTPLSLIRTEILGTESAATIKTRYESNSDTNAFTDAYSTLVGSLDADLATFSVPASTTVSAFGATLVDDVDAGTARTTLGVDAAGTDNSTDVTLAGTPDYLTIAGQVITRGQVDLAADVTGALPISAINATGTPSAANYLRGDGTWSAAAGGGASELSDLSDVNTSTPTNRYVLVADGIDFESRALTEADISDLGSYLTSVQLSDLTDVNTSTATNRNVLVADGIDWESRALVEADISDFGTYLTAVEGTDVNSTGPVTDGYVLTADGVGGAAWEAAASGGSSAADLTWASGTQSEVSDGATAVAFDFDTDNTYATSGAKLLTLSNNGTSVFEFTPQGGISHANSGATTNAHRESVNFNWSSSTSFTSSGQYSFVVGDGNKASGTNSIALGKQNTASGMSTFAANEQNDATAIWSAAFGSGNDVAGNVAFVTGYYNQVTSGGSNALVNGSNAKAEWKYAHVSGAGSFVSSTSQDGSAQIQRIPIRASTTDATQTTMLNGGNNVVIPADTTWAFTGIVVARSDETDGNVSAGWKIEGVLYRDESNNTTIQGVTTTNIYNGFSTAAVTVEADDTNEALAVKVTGEASTNIRWVAKLDIAQVGYP